MADNLRRGSYEEKGENSLAEKEENKNKREEYFRKYGEEGLPAKNKAPWLKRELDKKHSRRLYSHDYCSRGYYHITATMKAHTLHLSSLPNIPLSELKKNIPIYPILSSSCNKSYLSYFCYICIAKQLSSSC